MPYNQEISMQSTPSLTERDLLLHVREGDEHAFSKIYDQYAIALTSHLTYLLKSDELADEVVQETFIAVWEHRGHLDPEKSFKSYLYTIAVNKAHKLFRKAAYDQAYRSYLLPIIESGYNNIETYINAKENKELLTRLLSHMPEKQREVYLLHKVEGYSYKEISDLLEISLGTVNTHIHRANQYIKSQIVNRQEFLPILVSVLFGSVV